MGKQLTSLRPDGTRLNTSVYSGGTLVAKQTDTGNNWQITDPITGSKATYAYNGTATKEEFSGLGQKVSDQDPAEFPDPPANEIVSFWENMQWQCTEVPQEFWGSFGAMPFHCQMAILMNTDFFLPDIYGWSYEVRGEKQEKKESPKSTSFPSLSDSVMNFGLKAAAKPVGRDGGNPKPGDPCKTESGEPGRWYKKGKCLPEKGTVDVTAAIDMSETSYMPVDTWLDVIRRELADNAVTFLESDSDCEKLINEYIKDLNRITGKSVSSDIKTLVKEFGLKGNLVSYRKRKRKNVGSSGSVNPFTKGMSFVGANLYSEEANRFAEALTFIHEVLHTVGFSDRDFVNASAQIGRSISIDDFIRLNPEKVAKHTNRYDQERVAIHEMSKIVGPNCGKSTSTFLIKNRK